MMLASTARTPLETKVGNPARAAFLAPESARRLTVPKHRIEIEREAMPYVQGMIDFEQQPSSRSVRHFFRKPLDEAKNTQRAVNARSIALCLDHAIPFWGKNLARKRVRDRCVRNVQPFTKPRAPYPSYYVRCASHTQQLFTICEYVKFTKGDFTQFVSSWIMYA
jgi:hypothetical protein